MEFNPKQQAVIDAAEDNIVVVSPAGSGKTRVAIGSLERYRHDHPADNVVAITFTRKAAAELTERISAKNIEVSTIHSWAYRRLQSLASEFNFKVQLLDEDSIKKILLALAKKRRQYYLNQFQLYSYVMGNYNIDIDDRLKKVFEVIRTDYIKFKQQNTLYDFTDLPKYLLDKLKEYSQRITDIDALYVDEFQDIDAVQLELFNLVDSKRKMMIGDPAQSIYAFRGTVSDVCNSLPNFTMYNLTTNYRSYQEIIDYATTVRDAGLRCIDDDAMLTITDILECESSPIDCVRGKGGNVYVIGEMGQCILVSDNCRPCSDTVTIRSLFQDKRTQVLCRSNKQVKKIQALGIENVSTVHQAKGLEYDNVIFTGFPVDCEEELNIAYVGMTRAKNNLCVIDFDLLTYIICSENIKSINKLF